MTLALLAACGGGDARQEAASPATTAVGSGLESPVTGLVVRVEGAEMELEIDGRQISFEVIDATLPPGHLQEHLDQLLPVRVHFQEAPDGTLLATLVEDA